MTWRRLGVALSALVLPAGTLRARPGLPAAVLARGLLTFAFFGADTYVPLAITAAKGRSTQVASLAVTAATLAWTAGAWAQERTARRWSGRRQVTAGVAALAGGIATVAVALLPGMPVALIIAGWGVGGLGMGLAYAPLTLTVLAEAPSDRQGEATAALQLADNLGVALGAGLGGAFVAAGAARGWQPGTGIAAAFAMTWVVALAAISVAQRLPPPTLAATRTPA